MTNRVIEIAPLAYMRGRTLDHAYIILDEAQNATDLQIKMFLTRIGEDCLTVINGDIMQCDLEKGSGLRKAIDLVRQRDLPVPIVEFSLDDIVRSGICAMWVRAFEG
jgi:phosphate starvation-inducible PhoH-like protein